MRTACHALAALQLLPTHKIVVVDLQAVAGLVVQGASLLRIRGMLEAASSGFHRQKVAMVVSKLIFESEIVSGDVVTGAASD